MKAINHMLVARSDTKQFQPGFNLHHPTTASMVNPLKTKGSTPPMSRPGITLGLAMMSTLSSAAEVLTPFWKGLTLVHLSAHRKHFLRDELVVVSMTNLHKTSISS